MQKFFDLNRYNWSNIQQSLSSLIGYSLFIYDPTLDPPSTSPSAEHSVCQLVHKTGREALCQSTYKEQATLAISSGKIRFFKCEAEMTSFVIPIHLSNDVDYTIIGGKVYCNHSESASFKEKAIRRGVSPDKLSQAMKETCIVTEEALMRVAQDLQSIGTVLLENIYRRKEYQSKSSYLTTLTDVANQFRKDLAHSMHYTTLLITLGILFDLKSACVFEQNREEKLHRGIASFGEKKKMLDQSEAFLDGILQKKGSHQESIFVHEPADLLQLRLPVGVSSCHLFPLSMNNRIKATLAILDTILSADDTKMIASFCQQAGAALEHIALQNQIAKQKKTIRSLSDLTLFDSTLRHDALYNNLLEQTTQILDAEQGSLMVLDQEKNELSVMAMKGINASLFTLFNKKQGEGISGQVCKTGIPLLVENIAQDRRIRYTPRPRYRTPSFVSVPLKKSDRIIGVVNVADKINGQTFTDEDLGLLQAIGSFITMAMERSDLHVRAEELKEISITDPMTGLLNRRYFQERLTEEIERTRRHALPVCLMMIDIDDFKKVNDQYGHLMGDEVLKEVAQIIRNTIRTIDVASRFGGEEFTVILPHTTKEDAGLMAKRLCELIAKGGDLQKKIEERQNLTVSIGLASFPEDAETINELINSADQALYKAKHSGKNQVIVYHG
ncbi:diguanylate cyclase [Nitrospira defluvii]|nr:diguanylate cyclase [Nitrospira defluvii]